MELMLAIAIIAIISVISVVYIGGTINDEVKVITEQLKADLRVTRNLAVSRVTYNFEAPYPALGEVFPPGGYGIYVNPVPANDYYIIYADSGTDVGYNVDDDPVIKRVDIENSDIEVSDYRSATAKYFAFKSENEVTTNFGYDSYGRYRMLVRWEGPGYPEKGYQSLLLMGERSDDGYIWTPLGVTYSTYNPPAPPPPPREDPIMREMGF